MTSKTLRFIFDQTIKQWLTGRKRGMMEIQKFEYLENEKSFLDEIKTYLNGYRLVKNKNLSKNCEHKL